MSPGPIGADEWVLRRVHKSRCQDGDPPVVLRGGFCPSPEDTTGLSVYREVETSAEAVRAAGRKPDEYYVVRVRVKDLQALGFSLQEEEDPDGPPGHLIIPELSLAAYEANKKALKPRQAELARRASENLVVRPGQPPPQG
jgi:hypothetical protein